MDQKAQVRNRMKTLMPVLIPLTEIHMALEADAGHVPGQTALGDSV